MVDFLFSFGNTTIPQADVYKVLNDPRGPLVPHMRRIGRRIVAAARAQVGKETGKLAESIHYDIRRWGGLPEVWIGTYNDIALLHHEGTRPHAIAARDAKFLRFSAKGRVVYDRVVWHPGTKPNRFLTDNIYLARL